MAITKYSWRYDPKRNIYVSGAQGGGAVRFNPESGLYERFSGGKNQRVYTSYSPKQFESMLQRGQVAELRAARARLESSKAGRFALGQPALSEQAEYNKREELRQAAEDTAKMQFETLGVKQAAAKYNLPYSAVAAKIERGRDPNIALQEVAFQEREKIINREKGLYESPESADIFQRQQEAQSLGGIIGKKIPSSIKTTAKNVGGILLPIAKGPVDFAYRFSKDIYSRFSENTQEGIKKVGSYTKQIFVDLPGGVTRGLYKEYIQPSAELRLSKLSEKPIIEMSIPRATLTKLQMVGIKTGEFVLTKPVETLGVVGAVQAAGPLITKTTIAGSIIGSSLKEKPKEAASTLLSAGIIYGGAYVAQKGYAIAKQKLITSRLDSQLKATYARTEYKGISKTAAKEISSNLVGGGLDIKTKRFLLRLPRGGVPGSSVTVETFKSGRIAGLGKISKGLFISAKGTVKGFVDFPTKDARFLITQTPKTTSIKAIRLSTGKTLFSQTKLTLESLAKVTKASGKIMVPKVDARGERIVERRFAKIFASSDVREITPGRLTKVLYEFKLKAVQQQAVTVQKGKIITKLGIAEYGPEGQTFKSLSTKIKIVKAPQIKFGKAKLPYEIQKIRPTYGGVLVKTFKPGAVAEKIATVTVGSGARSITEKSLLLLKTQRILGTAIRGPAYFAAGAMAAPTSIQIPKTTFISAPKSPLVGISTPTLVSEGTLLSLKLPQKTYLFPVLGLGPRETTMPLIGNIPVTRTFPQTAQFPEIKVSTKVIQQPRIQVKTATLTKTSLVTQPSVPVEPFVQEIYSPPSFEIPTIPKAVYPPLLPEINTFKEIKKIKTLGKKPKGKYQPSLVAVEYNLVGKKPKVLTGVEIRKLLGAK